MIEMMTKEYARKRIAEAEKIVQVRPTPSAIGDLAACYFTLDNPEKAEPLARLAWNLQRDHAIGTNLAIILKDLGKHEESAQVIEQAYWLNPDDFYTKLAYGEALLKAGFWNQAWQVYDNARPTQQGAAADLGITFSIPEWDGQPLNADQKLLLINEGGTGDRISYARWIHELDRMGIDWIFFPYAELFSFFERIFPREKLIKDGDDVNPTYWTTTFALPAKLKAVPTRIPKPLPFTASEESIKKYQFNRADNLPIVGLCYSAAEKFQGDRKVRSLSEGQAMRLVCQTGDKVHWVNLQYGETLPYPVTNIPFETWEDTAGLIHNLDAVVSVDTGPMHLAGSMNKPMAVLLSGNSCWKFLRKGRKLGWYPSATFYRNETRGFENALNELIVDIRNGTVW